MPSILGMPTVDLSLELRIIVHIISKFISKHITNTGIKPLEATSGGSGTNDNSNISDWNANVNNHRSVLEVQKAINKSKACGIVSMTKYLIMIQRHHFFIF